MGGGHGNLLRHDATLVDRDDGEPGGAGQRRHGDPIPGAVVEQRLADGRLVRDAAGIEVDFGGIDDGVGLLAYARAGFLRPSIAR